MSCRQLVRKQIQGAHNKLWWNILFNRELYVYRNALPGRLLNLLPKNRTVYSREAFNRGGVYLKTKISAKQIVFLSDQNIKNYNNNRWLVLNILEILHSGKIFFMKLQWLNLI